MFYKICHVTNAILPSQLKANVLQKFPVLRVHYRVVKIWSNISWLMSRLGFLICVTITQEWRWNDARVSVTQRWNNSEISQLMLDPKFIVLPHNSNSNTSCSAWSDIVLKLTLRALACLLLLCRINPRATPTHPSNFYLSTIGPNTTGHYIMCVVNVCWTLVCG